MFVVEQKAKSDQFTGRLWTQVCFSAAAVLLL